MLLSFVEYVLPILEYNVVDVEVLKNSESFLRFMRGGNV